MLKIIHHYYLWVMKICAKFGRSRIPWMTQLFHSFTVYVKGASSIRGFLVQVEHMSEIQQIDGPSL